MDRYFSGSDRFYPFGLRIGFVAIRNIFGENSTCQLVDCSASSFNSNTSRVGKVIIARMAMKNDARKKMMLAKKQEESHVGR
jgi:hypothetical protein